ncbi:uncharacterized protein METZ01_LOCUS177012, partial [marine metagenome]
MLSRFRSLMITLPMAAFLAFGLSACATESEMEPAAGETEEAAAAGNPITGEGIPNPTSTVIENWGDLPEGREWGSTAGIDIDPHDGQVWAYERCGAGNFGGGVAITCDSNPVDPIFKFDRNTGEVLANFGG